MAKTRRIVAYVMVPVEVEILTGMEDKDGNPHVGTIRMPSTEDIHRSLRAHNDGKAVTTFAKKKDAWSQF